MSIESCQKVTKKGRPRPLQTYDNRLNDYLPYQSAGCMPAQFVERLPRPTDGMLVVAECLPCPIGRTPAGCLPSRPAKLLPRPVGQTPALADLSNPSKVDLPDAYLGYRSDADRPIAYLG